ncbi:hypothetical protein [Pedobacter nyackensis]|uniref:hypothetical protein n=1 Tax=Pedobacter nyackensis TaxID=475255 RepID=UPI0029311DE2|nr:hypothetical protein [Pedobacter nyackensis]
MAATGLSVKDKIEMQFTKLVPRSANALNCCYTLLSFEIDGKAFIIEHRLYAAGHPVPGAHTFL